MDFIKTKFGINYIYEYSETFLGSFCWKDIVLTFMQYLRWL